MNNNDVRICYFGIKESNYPRQRTISSFFETKDARIDRIEIDASLGFISNLRSLLNFAVRTKERYDVVILAEFSLQFALVAYLLAKRSRGVFVVDWFVGLFETRVEDYRAHRRLSPIAVAYYCADLVAARTADVVITDTQVRALKIKQQFRLKRVPITVPVGAPDWAQYLPNLSSSPNEPLRVLYYGNYIPLHGIDRFIEGAVLASSHIPLKMTLVGDGPLRKAIQDFVSEQDKDCQSLFDFCPPVDEPSLHAIISSHDIIVGIFGSSPKASSVVANKVWQGLASGRTVLTQTSAALTPYRGLFSGLLVECRPDPLDICRALVSYSTMPGPDDTLRRTAAASIVSLVEQGLNKLEKDIQAADSCSRIGLFGRR